MPISDPWLTVPAHTFALAVSQPEPFADSAVQQADAVEQPHHLKRVHLVVTPPSWVTGLHVLQLARVTIALSARMSAKTFTFLICLTSI